MVHGSVSGTPFQKSGCHTAGVTEKTQQMISKEDNEEAEVEQETEKVQRLKEVFSSSLMAECREM